MGPGGYKVETDAGKPFRFDHFFDGMAQVHRFEIASSTKVLYNSRHTCDEIVEQVRRLGHVGGSFTFAQGRDPCRSYFRKFMSFFIRGPGADAVEKGGEGNGMNISVNLSYNLPGYPSTTTHGTSLYAKTDASGAQKLDPESLEPLGLIDQRELHPELTGPLSCAHARTDPETGDLYNFNLEFCGGATYRIFRVVKETGKVDILATIRDAAPAYVHSFWLTRNYFILGIFGAHFALGGLKMLYRRNLLDALLPLDPKVPNKFYVIDRVGGRGVVAKYESDAFFAFHCINAWEEADDVILDVPTYRDLDCLHKFFYKNLLAEEDGWEWVDKAQFEYTRLRLPGITTPRKPPPPRTLPFLWPRPPPLPKAETVFKVPWQSSFELPTINPAYDTRPHRYTYGLNTSRRSTFMESIIKYDSQTHTSRLWSVDGHTPGEPIFVPDPEGKAEDDGVVVSVVLDGFSGTSYLLVLDARRWVERARVLVGRCVPLGIHGRFVDAEGKSAEY